MANTILLVDDDAAVLNTHLRLLEPLTATAPGVPPVSIEQASSGAEAEGYLRRHPTCAVVVSDLRMPEMDGVTLLERARTISPDAVCLMLTAHADLRSATEAINRTSVFRLLAKPCGGDALRTAVTDALQEHRRVIAGRHVFEQATDGSVQLLARSLSLMDPVGASKAIRVHRYVRHVIRSLALPDTWTLEVAAMLSHLDANVIASAQRTDGPASAGGAHAHQPLSVSTTHELLTCVPCLDAVGGIIARQHDPVEHGTGDVSLLSVGAMQRGGRVLRVAIDFDAAIVRGTARDAALAAMRLRPGQYDRAVVDSLRDVDPPEVTFDARVAALSDLRVGMILDEDWLSPSGLLMMSRGQEVSRREVRRLESFTSTERGKRLRVLVPRT
jgi:CheY-like chemotaxis protein